MTDLASMAAALGGTVAETPDDIDADIASFDLEALGGSRPPPRKNTRANAEIKRLLCMAHETYDPKALDALTRALVAQGFGK